MTKLKLFILTGFGLILSVAGMIGMGYLNNSSYFFGVLLGSIILYLPLDGMLQGKYSLLIQKMYYYQMLIFSFLLTIIATLLVFKTGNTDIYYSFIASFVVQLTSMDFLKNRELKLRILEKIISIFIVIFVLISCVYVTFMLYQTNIVNNSILYIFVWILYLFPIISVFVAIYAIYLKDLDNKFMRYILKTIK